MTQPAPGGKDAPAIDYAHYAEWRERQRARKARAAVPITTVLPRPKRLTLGGREWTVWPLRLRDLADLQEWLEQQVPHPLDGLEAFTGDERDAELRRRWIPSREWPPKLGTDAADELLATDAGIVAFVLVCLRTGQPDATARDAAETAAAMTAPEWTALRRLAWGSPPWRAIHAELAGDQEPDAAPPDWAEIAAHLGEIAGIGPDVLGSLTLAQLRAYRSGKGDVYQGLRPIGPESLKELMARERAMFGVNPPADSRRSPEPTDPPSGHPSG